MRHNLQTTAKKNPFILFTVFTIESLTEYTFEYVCEYMNIERDNTNNTLYIIIIIILLCRMLMVYYYYCFNDNIMTHARAYIIVHSSLHAGNSNYHLMYVNKLNAFTYLLYVNGNVVYLNINCKVHIILCCLVRFNLLSMYLPTIGSHEPQ